MKNDIWDILLRPKGKSMVNSKWPFNIKHGVDASIEKYKERFMALDYPRKREKIMMIYFLPLLLPFFAPVVSLVLVKDGIFTRWM